MRVHDGTSAIRPFIALQSIYQKPAPDHVSHVTYGTQVLSMRQFGPRQTGDGTPQLLVAPDRSRFALCQPCFCVQDRNTNKSKGRTQCVALYSRASADWN